MCRNCSSRVCCAGKLLVAIGICELAFQKPILWALVNEFDWDDGADEFGTNGGNRNTPSFVFVKPCDCGRKKWRNNAVKIFAEIRQKRKIKRKRYRKWNYNKIKETNAGNVNIHAAIVLINETAMTCLFFFDWTNKLDCLHIKCPNLWQPDDDFFLTIFKSIAQTTAVMDRFNSRHNKFIATA